MSRFLVVYVEKGDVKESASIEAADVEDLSRQLNRWHPDTPLEGYDGFRYITNGRHWAAAGYPDDTFADGYKEIRAPAPINPPFFHILRSVASM
jgi:hypothetical protein